MITTAIFVSFQSYEYHTLFVKNTKIEIPSAIILDPPSHKKRTDTSFPRPKNPPSAYLCLSYEFKFHSKKIGQTNG